MREYPPPYLSLDVPIEPPGPDKGPVCFTFDAKWLPYIIAVVKTLTYDYVYSGDHIAAQAEAQNLLAIFLGEGNCGPVNDLSGSEMDDCMGCCIRMRNGILQVLQCGEWVTVDGWDPKAIATAPTSGTDGTPQPKPGGCQTYIGKVDATSKWALPATINSGDTINVTNANGSWWTPLDLGIQRCPDGLIFFAGGCVDGTGHTEPGDPMPTAAHDALIAYDGTHYYDCSAAAEGGPATFTILSGITNGSLILMMNTPDTVGFGDVSFDIEICNNQAATWSHTLNFALSTSGFSAFVDSYSQTRAIWSAGHGFQQTTIIQPAGPTPTPRYTVDYIFATFAATTLTHVKAIYNCVVGANPFGDTLTVSAHSVLSGTDTSLVSQPTITAAGQVLEWSGSQNATELHLNAFIDDEGDGGTGGGSMTWLTLLVEGTGTDPFGP